MFVHLMIFIALGYNSLALPTDAPSTPPNTTPLIKPKSPCENEDFQTDCVSCLSVEGCIFVIYPDISENCQNATDSITEDGVNPEIIKEPKACHEPSPPETTTTTSAPDTTTSTITTSSTTTTTQKTTTDTTVTTTTSSSTTTTSTSTTTKPTTTITTTKPTTTLAPSTTSAPNPEPPTGKGHFDGWSFFGGILLTLGIAAIGFVGFKYYRLRSGSGGNYNRF